LHWGRAAVLLAPLVYLDWEVYAAWARGEFSIKPAIVFWWLLLPFHFAVLSGALPDALWTGEYPSPPEPDQSGQQWTIAAPGVSYGCVFPAAMLAIAAIASAISVAVNRGPQWTVEGVLVVVTAGTVIAAVVGFLLRSRPRLEVNEERQELVWRPGTLLGGRLTLPFAAVVAVEVITGKAGQYHPEIVWRMDKRRVHRTRLPAGATREYVLAVAARLHAVLGLSSDSRRLLF
jgi:hypothetical protein